MIFTDIYGKLSSHNSVFSFNRILLRVINECLIPKQYVSLCMTAEMNWLPLSECKWRGTPYRRMTSFSGVRAHCFVVDSLNGNISIHRVQLMAFLLGICHRNGI